MVKVIENFRGWDPSFDAKGVVEGLLGRLPKNYCIGLGSVVLTCAGRMPRRRRRSKTRSRKRVVRVADCRGLYHHAWRGEPAWIELFVDTIVGRCYPPALRLGPTQEYLLGDVLFHELGHHLHATQQPEHTEREVIAERWQSRLVRRQIFRRYWYWLPVYLFVGLGALLEKARRKRHRRRASEAAPSRIEEAAAGLHADD